MRHKERIDVKNIREKEIVKVVSIGQKDVRFRLQNAYVGQVGDNTELLDETLVDNMLELMAKAVKTNYSKYNPVPNEIIIRNTMSEKKEDKPADNKESQDVIESYEPRFALEQVALNEKVKEQIQTAIAAVRYKTKMTEEWGMSEYFSGNRAVILNFYGKAGTGKSMTAEAVAKALNKKVYHINYSELESKYVGETPKNIRRAFECATRDDWIELSAKTIQDFTEAELRFLRGVQIHLQSGCKEMDLRAKLRLISEIIFNYILLREKMVNID